jgi:Transglycosylase SLT domain
MSPRHSASHLRGVMVDSVEQIKAPGFAALLRRNPHLKRHAAFGSIALGAALFVVASMTTQLAGAETGHSTPQSQPSVTTTTAPPDLSGLDPVVDSAPAAVHAAPATAKAKAPTSRAVINGLAANGIPNVALNAYRVAAARMNHSDPGCGIDWSLLSGIGREESDHGRFAGATLNPDGTSTPRIIGIPLNGSGTEVVRDTDHGRLDGDTVYDRAVGPMQFIPSTWAGYGVDANGDGIADPFNINDAALTAARYLCAAGGNLRTHAGQVRAVLTYNHSDQYLAQVLALADAYHRGIALTGLPDGNTTGQVSPVDSKNVPPANPGGPTAVDKTTPKKTTPKTAPTKTAPKTAPTTRTSRTNPSTTPSAPRSTTPTGTTGPTPSPTRSTGAPTTGGSASPTPSPTKKCILWDVLNPGRCAVYA